MHGRGVGAWDVVAYLQRGVGEAAKASRQGNDKLEDGLNRIGLFLAHILSTVAMAPPALSLRAPDICAALPTLLHDLRKPTHTKVQTTADISRIRCHSAQIRNYRTSVK